MRFPPLLIAALSSATIPLTAASVQATSADAFVDSIGVNIHTHYQGTVYDHAVNLKAALVKLGVRHVRDGLVDSTWPVYYERLNDLGRSGIKATLITGFAVDRVLPTAAKVKEVIEAFEGPNEVNLNHWTPERASQYQKDLWATVRADATWNAVPVVSLSVTDYAYGAKLGDLSPFTDFGTIHPYAGGWEPENHCDWMKADLQSGIDGARAFTGTKPLIVTEIGYTSHQAKAGHVAVTPAVAGVYLPRVLLNTFSHGVQRTFLYELFDLHDNAQEPEDNFGLVHTDGETFKPAGVAMANLIHVLADPGPICKPGALDLTLSAAEARSQLFQKRDGTFLLAVWLPTSLWDQSRPYGQKQVEDPADKPCTVTFATAPKHLAVISGLDSTVSETQLASAATITLTASERVTILHITP
ncbi:MAG TPA: hypothetical protein VHX44_09255 [Planctomycetota bacterium]|nr:hypothetical protein [Planctomycetota bacterium]